MTKNTRFQRAVRMVLESQSEYDSQWAALTPSMETTFVLDALEQALWARRPSGTIHHSDKSS